MKKKNTPKTIENSRLLDLDEACEYLCISKRLMDDLTGNKQIKYIRLGGRKFRREWLDDFIDKNAIEPVDNHVAKRERPSKNNHFKETPNEIKIYNRVAGFNKNNPEKAVETPLEAKRKYNENGYIPDYIKNDDLQ